ncbi:MAG: electron transfer flavoprotein subunit alpha/FixB family protein [Magnetococcales bacterium]|nr:electron transfer flavoprotein subunit alpha/FixB family protein [Magnetococcales bacterium]
MKVLVVAGDRLGGYDPITAHGVAAGLKLGEVTVLASGPQREEKAREAAQLEGVAEVIQTDHPALQKPGVENLALLLAELTTTYAVILAASSTFGNDLIPRAAALAHRSPLTHICAIPDSTTLLRPIHAGNILTKLPLPHPPLFLTIRPTAFTAAASLPPDGPQAPITRISQGEESHLSRQTQLTPSPNRRPDPVLARVVVAGGGGLSAGGNFYWVEALADRLAGAVGASRAAVDLGLASNDLQIGQTGRSVAPELYIGLGISGAIQHLAGIKEAGMIISINSDPGAPLHSVADYALTADLYEAVPALIKALDNNNRLD